MKWQQWLNHAFFVGLFIIAIIGCNLSAADNPNDGPINNPPADDGTEPEIVSYRYDNLPDATQLSAATGEFRAISKFDKLNITYTFANGTSQLPNDEEHDLVRQAFALWAEQTPLTFTETADSATADIEIAWAVGNHGDGDPFDRNGGVLAHASFPNPFFDRQLVLHFDDDERWVNSASRNVDLLTVAIHEIGHNLGLDHSSDPEAIMFSEYRGPRRTLSQDDIDGVQSLYGPNNVQPTPQAPPPQATPPPSNRVDSDRDGLSDAEEIWTVGTDPQDPDTDNDGITDGVEVQYLMNPLDADMDKDGFLDGEEVQAGTDPFVPNQPSQGASSELVEEVGIFLGEVIQFEIEAYRRGDANIAAQGIAGQPLIDIRDQINSLNEQGLVQIAELDFYTSYIEDVQVINNNKIEASTCETWYTTLYQASDGTAVAQEGPTLVPQTITIERFREGWFVTDVQFFDAPAFCR